MTGAGDTVLASLGYSLSIGSSIQDGYFSNIAAGIAVGKIGAASVTKNEIDEYIKNNNLNYNSKIITASLLKNLY